MVIPWEKSETKKATFYGRMFKLKRNGSCNNQVDTYVVVVADMFGRGRLSETFNSSSEAFGLFLRAFP